jgi:hypothetical protein
MRIFDGKSRSTVRAPKQPDVITVEDWRLLQLDIQVRFLSSHSTHTNVLVTDIENSLKA